MRIIEKVDGVHFLYFLENKLFIQKSEEIADLIGNAVITINPYNGSLSEHYFYKINENNVEIFDSELTLHNVIYLEKPSAVQIIDDNYYIISSIINENKYNNFYFEGQLIAVRPRFFGKVFNQNYRLNFPEGTFNKPRYFRCSDLLDKTTYWEYDCGEGYSAGRFYLWKDYLVFVKGNHENASLVLIDLPTGRVVWENYITYGEFTLDEKNGLLVSVWANKYVGNNYQIIDLNKRSIEVDRFQSPIILENVAVNWQLQYLYKNKLYFVDNVHSTFGEEPRPIRFGCFDIGNKELNFIQEVPEASGGQFGQVIYHQNRLYLRSAANELFIFEDSPAN